MIDVWTHRERALPIPFMLIENGVMQDEEEEELASSGGHGPFTEV
jgi:hypothetical protein